jgi:CheY-like chemotaxis protein
MIASPDATNNRSEPPTILIVDDEPAIVDLLSQLLEDEGYRVVSAGDGQAAWETARELRPDLVIADVMMPRMDGLALVDRLANGSRPVPVILMSAAVESRRQGVPFIAKPFDLGELLDLVSTYIG